MLQTILTQLQAHPWVASDPGFRGLMLFGLVAALSQLVLLPITAFAILAGFLFGFWHALPLMLAAKMLAASLNFAVTRFGARTPAIWLTRKFPLFHTLNVSLEREGLRLAILMRLCPFPFAVASYGYGLTRIPFVHYLIASFIGTLGPSLIFVGVGVSARDGLETLNGSGAPKSPWEMYLFLLGIVAAVLVTRRISRIAREKITERSVEPTGPGHH